MDIDIGIRHDGELIAHLGDSGIAVALFGLPIDAAGEHLHLVQIAAHGMNLVPLIAPLTLIACTQDGACLWFPTVADPDPHGIFADVCQLLLGLHFIAARMCDDVEAMRALSCFPGIGGPIAEMEARKLAAVACGSGHSRRSTRL